MYNVQTNPYAHTNNSRPSNGEQKRPKHTKVEEPVLPLYSWRTMSGLDTSLYYARDDEQANKIVEERFESAAGPVGFDLEWKPQFVKGRGDNPVALVQIANKDAILLAQVSAMKRFPQRLASFLDNSSIIKVGVNIHGDCKKLFMDHGICVRSCVELSYLAKCVDPNRWFDKGQYKNLIALNKLVRIYEGYALSKGEVQLSNWEMPLTEKMQNYSANDCHSGLVLYTRLFSDVQKHDENNAGYALNPSLYTFDVLRGIAYYASGEVWRLTNPNPQPWMEAAEAFKAAALARKAEMEAARALNESERVTSDAASSIFVSSESSSISIRPPPLSYPSDWSQSPSSSSYIAPDAHLQPTLSSSAPRKKSPASSSRRLNPKSPVFIPRDMQPSHNPSIPRGPNYQPNHTDYRPRDGYRSRDGFVPPPRRYKNIYHSGNNTAQRRITSNGNNTMQSNRYSHPAEGPPRQPESRLPPSVSYRERRFDSKPDPLDTFGLRSKSGNGLMTREEWQAPPWTRRIDGAEAGKRRE